MKPVVCGSIEVSRGEEDLLSFGQEQFGAAEKVVAAFGEVHVELVSVSVEHVRGGHLRAPAVRRG